MQTFTRCPHCQIVNTIQTSLLGKAMACEKCRRIFIASVLTGDDREAAIKEINKNLPFAPEGNQFTLKDLHLEMRRFLPVTFTMGNGMGSANEKPEHEVILTHPMYMSSCLITQQQYQKVMEDSPSYFNGDLNPVETVSWHQALEFCRRLTEREQVATRLPGGAYFRLPTEAEWEYVCRSGEEGKDGTPGGTVVLEGKETVGSLTRVAWFQDNSGGTTHPVASKKCNSLDIYDMQGNVSEWCLDDYGIYPDVTQTDPVAVSSSGQKVRRGGGWASVASRCRSTDRAGVPPETRCALIGFRVVLTQDGKCPYKRDFFLI